MRDKRTPRLELWTRHITRISKLVRALTVLLEDVKVFLDRSRALFITVVILILTISASLRLL